MYEIYWWKLIRPWVTSNNQLFVRLQVECPTIEEVYFPSVKKCKIANKSELPSANKCMLPVGPCPPVSEVRHFSIWNSSKVAKFWNKLEKKKKEVWGILNYCKSRCQRLKIVTWKWIKTFSILSKQCVWTQVLQQFSERKKWIIIKRTVYYFLGNKKYPEIYISL